MTTSETSFDELSPLTVLDERLKAIAALIADQGAVRVGDLSRRFGVSEVTIRTDLERLAHQGLVVRYRGGAMPKLHTNSASHFEERVRRSHAQKERIGEYAVQLVEPGATLLLDAGTTVMELAKRLRTSAPLTVITNAINTAVVLSTMPGIHVIVPGGSLSPETVSTIGFIAERDIGDLLVDTLFLGAHSFELERGILDVSVEIARVKKAMVGAARRIVMLADSSKFEARALAKVAPLNVIHTLVTDTDFGDKETKAVESMGIEVVRV